MAIVESAQNFIGSLSLGSSTLFGGLFLVFLVVWGLSLGKTRVVVSLISLYLTYAIVDFFPYWDQVEKAISTVPFYAVQLAIFGLIYILTFFILNGSFIKKRFAVDDFSLIAVLVASFLQIMFLAAVCLSFVPREVIEPYLKGFYPLIAQQPALFVWIVLPVPGMVLLSALRR